MVMIFQSEKARRFLLEKGFVFTFRAHRRKKVGRDWITARRGGRKIADVEVKEEGIFNPSELKPYVRHSGFKSISEWIEEIRRLNGGKLPAIGWLYKVSLLPRKGAKEVVIDGEA